MTRIAPYPLRMPPEMRDELEKIADESRRSLQQEIIYRLDSYESIRTLLRNLPIKGDPYEQVMVLLRAYTQVERQTHEIESLKKRLSALAESTKSSDVDRFIEIEQQAKNIKSAISKLIKQIPPRFEE
ncbi:MULTISPECIES: Arc family DNA-binding protein [Providencia]|uniref:Arc family DNA-binding protein n=1 Tax=Providencia TaxID=586 RepID=UPI00197DEFEE|nr:MULTISPECIES: Arc family DNA-binding protein [Providencia]MBN4867550.1 Arc family DNA-binding protein [Providencia stuartii]MBN4877008.1 Arc family DNA-binding protein [Providencia stuartii]MBN4881587.1 Arc family DNA-binding protein [Providencia stuartii]MBN4886084.1 Arc family DNA-binding protein [Providencia stuartii]